MGSAPYYTRHMDFHKLTLDDKNLVSAAFSRTPKRSCEAIFGNNFIWRKVYNVEVGYKGDYCVKRYGEEGKLLYSFPAGSTDDEALKALILELLDEAHSAGYPLIIDPILEADKERLERLFPGSFRFEANRDYFDYLYTVDKLANLAGKKLHGKRNHIARFMDNPNWSYEPITKDNMKECLALYDTWFENKDLEEDSELLEEVLDEKSAVISAFKYFDELNLVGGLIRREGKVIAFAIGEELSPDTFDVHIEKADATIQGAYPMINREFVRHNCMNYTYVNREEDTGDEGLRKAKLSYYPDILLEKFTAYYEE